MKAAVKSISVGVGMSYGQLFVLLNEKRTKFNEAMRQQTIAITELLSDIKAYVDQIQNTLDRLENDTDTNSRAIKAFCNREIKRIEIALKESNLAESIPNKLQNNAGEPVKLILGLGGGAGA